jgi:predicted protein tyrosine phosphatase
MILSNDHWLFVCSANYVRSPTAEYVARRDGLLASSCGAPPPEGIGAHFVCVPLSRRLIGWATIIVCMEQVHVQRVMSHPLAGKRKVYCWDLPDDWGRAYDPQLVNICERKLGATLSAWESRRELEAIEDRV